MTWHDRLCWRCKSAVHLEKWWDVIPTKSQLLGNEISGSTVKFTHHSKFSDWIFAVFGCRTSMPAPSLASLARGCRAGMNYSVMHKSCVREPQDPERNAEAAEVMLADFKGKLSGISEMTTLRWRKESWWLNVRQVHNINVLAALWLTLSFALSWNYFKLFWSNSQQNIKHQFSISWLQLWTINHTIKNMN